MTGRKSRPAGQAQPRWAPKYMRKEKLQKFPSEATFEVASGAIITLGISLLFWRRNHGRAINQLLPENQISEKWYTTCLWLKIAIVVFAVTKIFVPHPAVKIVLQHLGNVSWVLEIIWNFKIRSGMNLILRSQWKTSSWYSACWTFIFGAIYLQYKLNCLKKEEGLSIEPDKNIDLAQKAD